MVVQRIRQAVGKLDLSQDQQAKVNAILDSATEDAAKLAEQLQNTPPNLRMQQVTGLAKDIRDKLAQVLDADQMKSLQQNFTAATTAPGGGPGGGMLALLQQAVAKLDLSADQRQQIQDLIQTTRSRVQDERAKGQTGPELQQDLQQLRQDVRS